MAKIVKPLSATQVEASKSKSKEYHLHDGRGLALRVKPSGSKHWIFNYKKPFTDKRTNLGLGPYPAISLAAARNKGNLFRELLADNVDPKSYKAEQEENQFHAHAQTLEHIAKRWIEIKSTTVTPDHANDIYRSIEIHILPILGNQPIHKVRAPATIEVLQSVANKGNLETVKRLCQRLNEIMTFAVNTGVLESNPLAGISSAFEPPIKKHLPTIKPDQLPQLMRALSNASINRTTRCLIEWQLHTITRPFEAAGTRWDELDTEARLWRIPATRMKTKKEHIVPLSVRSLSLLDYMKSINCRSEFVFPSDIKLGSHINSQTANMALKRMGYGGLLVAHGLRSVASTILNNQGFEPELIEVCLSHIDKNQVRSAYNRADYLERRQKIMDWWSEHITQAATGNFSLADD
jgi:integrase